MEKDKASVLERVLSLAQQDSEFDKELRKKLGIASNANSSNIDGERLNQIYEYCIEEILRKQAENFYDPFFKDFPEKPRLVDDFVNMEHERHRGRFDYYSLCIYEQIERILNAIFSVPKFNDCILKKSNKLWNEYAYEIKDKKYSIGNVIWGEDKGDDKYLSKGINRAENNKLTVRDKIRIVIFFFKYYATQTPLFKIGYDSLCKNYQNIYLCRNTIHRGEEQSEDSTEILKEIHANTSSYYFEFNWLLTEFVRLTNDYQNTIEVIIKKLTKEYRAVVSSIVGSAAFVKVENESQPTLVPDNLFPQLKGKKVGDPIIIVKIGGNITEIKTVS